MNGNVPGSVSKDFPLYHSPIIPVYENPNDIKHVHKIAQNSNTYTNEHPDFFRLDGMKEGGYKNPYLDQIIKVDRNECFKKLNTDRKNLNFIDFIKTNRKYSQDPKILRYISSDEDVELRKKRHAFETPSKDYRNKILLTEGNNKNYSKILKNLNFFTPKIDYRIKRTFDMNNSVDDKCFNKVKIYNNNDKNFRNSSNFEFDNNKNNISDFAFVRKPVSQYNPIKDRMEVLRPPPYRNQKWSSFLENYYVTMNSQNMFRRQGGLFSEFADKNINSIMNDKYDIQQKIKKQKEEKNGKKSDNDEDTKNRLKYNSKFK